MREEPTECKVNNKKDKVRRSTMHQKVVEVAMEAEEDTKEEEAMEVMVMDEEGVRSCVTIVTNLDILPEISQTPVRHVSIAMPLTILLNIVLSY